MNITNDTFMLNIVNQFIEDKISSLKENNDENSKILEAVLLRTSKVLENIQLYGIDPLNKTYKEFCQYIDNKKNVIFLSDEELHDVQKALKIYKIIKQIDSGGEYE